jgi:hypothetical protein
MYMCVTFCLSSPICCSSTLWFCNMYAVCYAGTSLYCIAWLNKQFCVGTELHNLICLAFTCFFIFLRNLRNKINAKYLFFFNIHACVHPEWDKYMLEKGDIIWQKKEKYRTFWHRRIFHSSVDVYIDFGEHGSSNNFCKAEICSVNFMINYLVWGLRNPLWPRWESPTTAGSILVRFVRTKVCSQNQPVTIEDGFIFDGFLWPLQYNYKSVFL